MKKKVFALIALVIVSLSVGIFAGGQGGSAAAASPESNVVTVWRDARGADHAGTKALNEAFTKETGIEVQTIVIPGEGNEIYQRLDVALLSGERVDVMRFPNPVIDSKYRSSGLLLPLNQLLEQIGYNYRSVHGNYLKFESSGDLLSLPYEQSIHAVFYNKDLFDKAGVPYPRAPWTWTDYAQIAQQITSRSESIYGSSMMNYPYMFYFLARQQNVPAYKPDGTSNFDHPAFAESLKFFKDMTEVYQAQRSYTDFVAERTAWDHFASSNSIGMHFVGSWYTGLLTNYTDYPRDWRWGVVPSPAAGPNGNNNLVAGGTWAVNKNAQNPGNAARYVAFVSNNYWKYFGGLPARVDLTNAEVNQILGDIAAKSNGSVTVEELNTAFFNHGMGVVDEKIGGDIASQYENIIKQWGELYLVGELDLSTTVQRIKTDVDRAIIENK